MKYFAAKLLGDSRDGIARFIPSPTLPIPSMRHSERLVSFHRPIAIACVLFCEIACAPNCSAQELSFNRDIRPILSENCYHCHGPDENAIEAGLRLDSFEAATESVIEPGNAEDSELVARIFSDDPDTLMPPPDSERALTQQQKERLRKWIDEGAEYQSHWSFIPPKRTIPPKAIPEFRVHHAIDRFVQRKINEAGLRPAKSADRETLIRRITFDLIGLPPTLEEIDRFVKDDSADAFEKLIDRLLADPRFGERMAADWLDVARYSDTYGYQVDRDRFVWPWRDWVVSALNQNLPYDQFMIEQLAGDLIPGATRDQILATTFNRLHPQKVEGGSVPEEFRIEYVADRTQTVGTAFMGLTFECCRCHNHKYDPISQSEYYQLSAYFANIDEAGLYSYFTPAIPTPTLTLPNDDQAAKLTQLSAKVAELEKALPSVPTVSANSFERSLFTLDRPDQTDPSDPVPLFAQPVLAMSFDDAVAGPNQSVSGIVGNAVMLTGDDPVNTEFGNYRRDQPFSISCWIKTPDHKERAVIFHRSRAWTDAASRGYQLLIEDGRLSWSLIHFWPGNAMRIRAKQAVEIDQWMHVVVTNDGSSKASGLSIWLDGKKCETEVVRDNLTKHITGGGGDKIAIGERFRDRGFTKGSVDEFAVFECVLTPLEIQRLATLGEKLDWIERPPSDWTNEQRNLMSEHLTLRHDADVAIQSDLLQTARRQWFALQDQLQEIMVMREAPFRRTSYRLNRGAYDDRAEPVKPGTPQSVNSAETLIKYQKSQPANRLDFAKWLSNPDHPLSSRVAVNRIWQQCFGIGLVRTPEDFGSQGALPTHPELLDWLAVDFVEHGWDVKRLIKQIMLSATYRQSTSHDDATVFVRDPENRLLARQHAYRLSAEMLRDQALALSGQLDSKIGGPPVKPYEVEASFKPAAKGSGSDLYRRSLYTYWRRTGPAPAMMALDASKRDVCRMQRERTSSPIQAFVLLNGPQYVEAARGVAETLLKKYGSGDDQVEDLLSDAFRLLTSRHPTESEIGVLKNLYWEQIAYFTKNEKRTNDYLAVGEKPVDGNLNKTHTAALGVVVGTLMNFDESVMKR